MTFEEDFPIKILDVTYCNTIADLRNIVRLFETNAIKKPKFQISNELYQIYLGNLNDKARDDAGVELAKNDEVVLDGVKCIILVDEKLCSKCEQKVKEVIDSLNFLQEGQKNCIKKELGL